MKLSLTVGHRPGAGAGDGCGDVGHIRFTSGPSSSTRYSAARALAPASGRVRRPASAKLNGWRTPAPVGRSPRLLSRLHDCVPCPVLPGARWFRHGLGRWLADRLDRRGERLSRRCLTRERCFGLTHGGAIVRLPSLTHHTRLRLSSRAIHSSWHTPRHRSGPTAPRQVAGGSE